jgi:hypothetical protein
VIEVAPPPPPDKALTFAEASGQLEEALRDLEGLL